LMLISPSSTVDVAVLTGEQDDNSASSAKLLNKILFISC